MTARFRPQAEPGASVRVAVTVCVPPAFWVTCTENVSPTSANWVWTMVLTQFALDATVGHVTGRRRLAGRVTLFGEPSPVPIVTGKHCSRVPAGPGCAKTPAAVRTTQITAHLVIISVERLAPGPTGEWTRRRCARGPRTFDTHYQARAQHPSQAQCICKMENILSDGGGHPRRGGGGGG